MELRSGMVAVVTGAASGIGRGLAERFAREGLRVVLADVEAAALERAASELRGAGAEVLAVPTDVSDGAQVERLAAATVERFGAAHVVCNNAGVGGVGGPVWRATVDDWAWTLGVNLWGVIHGIRAFVPLLVEQGEGHVVNTASLAGLMSPPFLGPYSATKHAVVAISEVLHAELAAAAPGVGVSVLCPEWVATRIADSDRNRPASLPDTNPPGPEAAALRTMLDEALAKGMHPDVVAQHVLAAIRGGRLYVFTHPEALHMVQQRLDQLLAGLRANEPSPGPAGA